MRDGDRPEPRGRKARLQNERPAGPQGRQHGVALRVGVIERHRDEVYVVLAQLLVRGAHARPPQRIGVVQSTALGRDVVPDVYCTPKGAAGSAARGGSRAGSASNAAKRSPAAGGAAGASPQSVSVTAAKLRPGAASDSSARNFGCVIAPMAREWLAKYASSSALDRAFVVTAMAPRMPQPNHANSASGQFSR